MIFVLLCLFAILNVATMSTTTMSYKNPVCKLPLSLGGCINYKSVYGYNHKDTQRCEPFIYGGCRGNLNRFNTLAECRAECEDDY